MCTELEKNHRGGEMICSTRAKRDKMHELLEEQAREYTHSREGKITMRGTTGKGEKKKRNHRRK